MPTIDLIRNSRVLFGLQQRPYMSGKGAHYKNLYGGGGRGTGGGRAWSGSSDGPPVKRARVGGELPIGTNEDLRRTLLQMDGRPYSAYREIEGSWSFPTFELYLDHAQSDPFAPPSKARVLVPLRSAGFPEGLFSNKNRLTALSDYLTRAFHDISTSRGYDEMTQSSTWSGGKGGQITIDRPGQQILERSSVFINVLGFEARFTVGLPARGRTIMGEWAADILCRNLPDIVHGALYYSSHDPEKIEAFVACVFDQDMLRMQVEDSGFIAFVPNGAILPRASGASDLPLTGPDVVPFISPPNLQVAFTLPSGRQVAGMGVKKGTVTLIAGGGFHGKSTLLDALAFGCYYHIPGDGREFIVADPSSFQVRSEDGRSVSNVDISSFIGVLPGGKDTKSFSTQDASGSTSCAASVIEALELGSQLLFLDEDTCATNFLIRDARMQRLVSADREPITPLIHKVRALVRERQTSLILVIGGCGDYIDVADLVLQMDNYHVKDVTERARQVASELPSKALNEEAKTFGTVRPRTLDFASLSPPGGGKTRAIGTKEIQYGSTTLDLTGLSQLAHPSQTRAIEALLRTGAKAGGEGSCHAQKMAEWVTKVDSQIYGYGLNSVLGEGVGYKLDGFLARPRLMEMGMALNRLRSVRMSID